MKKFTAILIVLSFAFVISGCGNKTGLKLNKGQVTKEQGK